MNRLIAIGIITCLVLFSFACVHTHVEPELANVRYHRYSLLYYLLMHESSFMRFHSAG